MKKIVFFLALLLVVSLFTLGAKDRGDIPGFSFDLGLGVTFAQFGDVEKPQDEVEEAMQSLANLSKFLETFRAGAYINLRYDLSKMLSVGGRTGIYTVTYEGINEKSVTFFDVPLHAIARLRFGPLAAEGFVGYYISDFKFGSELSGLEAGLRGYLGGLYAGAAILLADDSLLRFEAGYELTDLF